MNAKEKTNTKSERTKLTEIWEHITSCKTAAGGR